MGDRGWFAVAPSGARPITTLLAEGDAIAIPIEAPPGVRILRDSFHDQEPISPFGRVALTEQILKVLPRVSGYESAC